MFLILESTCNKPAATILYHFVICVQASFVQICLIYRKNCSNSVSRGTTKIIVLWAGRILWLLILTCEDETTCDLCWLAWTSSSIQGKCIIGAEMSIIRKSLRMQEFHVCQGHCAMAVLNRMGFHIGSIHLAALVD